MLDLLRAAPLIDRHNDLLWELRQGRDPADPTLMTDLPRMAAGGVGGQFWSVYVPSDVPVHQAVTATFEQIDALLDMVRRNPDRLELARSADDVQRIAAAGRVASMIGVEGGHSIGGSLGTLRVMAGLGMGYLTLTHNDDTPWTDSATGDHPHGGLTRAPHKISKAEVIERNPSLADKLARSTSELTVDEIAEEIAGLIRQDVSLAG